MKNLKKFKDALVSLALPVPSGATAGQVVLLGDMGLYGVLKTARATTATITAGTAAQGLADGEATVILPKVSLVLELTVAVGGDQFDAVYITPTNTYSTSANSGANKLIGYLLADAEADAVSRVAIV